MLDIKYTTYIDKERVLRSMHEHLRRVLNLPQAYLTDDMLTTLGRFAVLEQALSFTDPNHKACLSRDSARASTFLLMNICSRHGGEQSCQVIKCIVKMKAKCMNQTFVSLRSLISKTDQNKIKSNREILTP
jgi:hypothetical protein